MTSHVLVPVDGSDRSTEALGFALEEYPDAEFTALYVVDPADAYVATEPGGGAAMANYDRIRSQQEDRAERVLGEARDVAADRGVEIETDQGVGSVSRTIVEYADEHGIDHLVIGSHGRSGVSRVLLGSVAESVARRSPVPVTIVR